MSSPEQNDVITGTEASLTSASSSKSPTVLSDYDERHASHYHALLTSNSSSNNNNKQQAATFETHRASPYPETKLDPAASCPWTLGSTDGGAYIAAAGGTGTVNTLGGTCVKPPRQQPKDAGDGDDSIPEVVNTGAAIAASSGKAAAAAAARHLQQQPPQQSLYQDRLFRQASASVEAVLAASCEVMGFDIAEMWLRTGAKTHQLTNSHLRPTALEDSVRKDIVDVYYGEKSSERTHRLSPALCKRAKEAGDVIWVTASNPSGAEVLRCSISNVRTAVAVPVCHEASNTNITIIFFSIRRCVLRILWLLLLRYCGGNKTWLACYILFFCTHSIFLLGLQNNNKTNVGRISVAHVAGGRGVFG